MSNKINEEMTQIAEIMEKSMPTEERSVEEANEVLINTIKTLGPETVKKAMPNLSGSQKEILKSALEKAISMDDSYQPERDKELAINAPVEMDRPYEKEQDEDDEKLMKPEAAAHNHQGDITPEGRDGHVIKAATDSEGSAIKTEKPKMLKMKTASMGVRGRAANSFIKGEEGSEDAKEDKKIAEKEVKEHEDKMHKGEENTMEIDLTKSEMMYKVLYKMIEKGYSKDKIMGALDQKGYDMEKMGDCYSKACKDYEGTMKKSEEMPTEDEALESVNTEEIVAKSEETEEIKEEEKIEKSIVWNAVKHSSNNSRFGVNTTYSVDEYITKSHEEEQEVIAKGGFLNDSSEENLEKSEGEELDLNDLIEQELDMDADNFKKSITKEEAKGTMVVKSFSDEEMAAALGMSTEDLEKIK